MSTKPPVASPLVAVVASVACLNESQAVILHELADHLPNLTGREREDMLRSSNESLAQSVKLKRLLQSDQLKGVE